MRTRILIFAGALVAVCCGSVFAARTHNVADRGLLVEEKVGGRRGGVKVVRALADAADAGLASGDIITRVDGAFVTDFDEFVRLMSSKSATASIRLTLVGGTEKVLYKPLYGGAWQSNLGKIVFRETRRSDGSVTVVGDLTPYGSTTRVVAYINGTADIDDTLRGNFSDGKVVELIFEDPRNRNVITNDIATIAARVRGSTPRKLTLFRIN